ncbi:MAG: hypothetical protein GXO42_01230 [bacterium]|nr:hypothetical protein [bacterium]
MIILLIVLAAGIVVCAFLGLVVYLRLLEKLLKEAREQLHGLVFAAKEMAVQLKMKKLEAKKEEKSSLEEEFKRRFNKLLRRFRNV